VYVTLRLSKCELDRLTPTSDNTRWAEDGLLFIFVIKTLHLLLSETGIYFLFLFNVSFRYSVVVLYVDIFLRICAVVIWAIVSRSIAFTLSTEVVISKTAFILVIITTPER
jgi:hypothetical protein